MAETRSLISMLLDGRPRVRLFQQTAGAADPMRPVLYVHGATFGCANSIFFKFGGRSWADALNEAGFAVWGLDFAGFASSEFYPEMELPPRLDDPPLGPAPDATRQVERAVAAILATTGARRISLVAHSWGTMPAARFAGDNPALVDRLVLFGPVVRRETLKNNPPLGSWRFITVDQQKARFIEDVPPGEPQVLVKADFAAWAETYLGFDTRSGSQTPPAVRTPNGPLADIMAAWSGNLAYDPARVKAAVLVIRGEWDSLCTDSDVAWLKQAMTGATSFVDLKVPKATHLMHLETGRVALHAAVGDFLRNGSRDHPGGS